MLKLGGYWPWKTVSSHLKAPLDHWLRTPLRWTIWRWLSPKKTYVKDLWCAVLNANYGFVTEIQTECAHLEDKSTIVAVCACVCWKGNFRKNCGFNFLGLSQPNLTSEKTENWKILIGILKVLWSFSSLHSTLQITFAILNAERRVGARYSKETLDVITWRALWCNFHLNILECPRRLVKNE